jgi:predicted metal-dependent HD superfamily phosphohydrolase
VNSRSTFRGDDQSDSERIAGIAELAWTEHVDTDLDLFDRLVSRHRERQRRYHRIGHVEAVLGHIDELAETESIDDHGAVVAAALYHDAIYESQHPANERASARLARRDLTALGWDEARVDRVGTMIEGTATHLDPGDTDTAVLFDADLAILGSDSDRYRSYASAVRDEYGHFDNAEWTAGRAIVLAGFLERPTIYATAGGRDRWEVAARSNITAELAELRA